MLELFPVEVRMPEWSDRWEVAMVRADTKDVMVRVHLNRKETKVPPKYHWDTRAFLFVVSAERRGIVKAIVDWDEQLRILYEHMGVVIAENVSR